jgi:hypothetical protein
MTHVQLELVRRVRAPAIECLRRLPSRRISSTYCPARYRSRSLAGSCSRTIATSGAALTMDATRQGILRTGMSPAAATTRASITRSLVGLAQHSSAWPRTASSALSAFGECSPCSIPPSSTRDLHEPQAPFLQPYGSTTPWRSAASRTNSSSSTVN